MRCVRDNVNKIWNRNAKKEKNKTKQNKQKKITRGTENNKGDRNYSKRVRAKWFCCTSKLGFPQLISKACLIFK